MLLLVLFYLFGWSVRLSVRSPACLSVRLSVLFPFNRFEMSFRFRFYVSKSYDAFSIYASLSASSLPSTFCKIHATAVDLLWLAEDIFISKSPLFKVDALCSGLVILGVWFPSKHTPCA